MEKIFDGLSALILVLIAIPPVIWVISISFLGQAIKITQEAIKKKQEENKKLLEKLRKEAETKLAEAETKGEEQVEKAQQALNERDKEIKRSKKDIKITKRKYSYLAVTQGIVIPFSLFLSALVIIWLRSYYQDNILSLSLALVSILLLITTGIYQIYLTMKLIEDIAQRTQPILELEFKPPPPFEMFQSSTCNIEINIALKQAEVARSASAMFFIPKGFDYVNEKVKWNQDQNCDIPEALTISRKWDTILPNIFQIDNIIIKAPNKPSEYALGYSLQCEGFSSGFKEVKVIVKPTEFKIIKATYGTPPNKVLDVTGIVHQHIKEGRLEILINNKTFKCEGPDNDPDYGNNKKVVITYSLNGAQMTEEYPEGQTVILP